MLVEGFGGGLPVEGLSGPAVECCGDRVEVASGVSGEVCAFGEVLAQQAVGVLVGAALPGAVGVTEVDVEAGIDSQLGVLGHLGALCQRGQLATADREILAWDGPLDRIDVAN